jgi:hypothetical protein
MKYLSPVGAAVSGGVRPLAFISPAAALVTGGLTKKKKSPAASGQGGMAQGAY